MSDAYFDQQEMAQHIQLVAQRLHQRNMLAATDGNISCRWNDHQILITPSGRAKAFIEPADMVLMSMAGEATTRGGNPSGERFLHLAIYQHCPVARAVVHAHPPTAIALSLVHRDWNELPGDLLSEVILAMGSVPIVPYARPGTADLGHSILPYLPESRVLILAQHGAVTWGEDLDEAYFAMERLEHVAQILHRAYAIGIPSSLPANEVDYLKEQRRNMGERIL